MHTRTARQEVNECTLSLTNRRYYPCRSHIITPQQPHRLFGPIYLCVAARRCEWNESPVSNCAERSASSARRSTIKEEVTMGTTESENETRATQRSKRNQTATMCTERHHTHTNETWMGFGIAWTVGRARCDFDNDEDTVLGWCWTLACNLLIVDCCPVCDLCALLIGCSLVWQCLN